MDIKIIEYKKHYDDFGGEMISFERRFLFDIIIKHRPKIVFEVGSGSAGSTRIILSALNELNNGSLYNCDPYNTLVLDIKDVDTKSMTFYQTYGSDFIKKMNELTIIPDLVFFDGPEEPDTVLEDFKLLDSMVSNCIFVSHDWENRQRIDGNVSIKSQAIRPYLHQSDKWKIITELSGVKGEYPNNPGYNSVGMVYAIKE